MSSAAVLGAFHPSKQQTSQTAIHTNYPYPAPSNSISYSSIPPEFATASTSNRNLTSYSSNPFALNFTFPTVTEFPHSTHSSVQHADLYYPVVPPPMSQTFSSSPSSSSSASVTNTISTSSPTPFPPSSTPASTSTSAPAPAPQPTLASTRSLLPTTCSLIKPNISLTSINPHLPFPQHPSRPPHSHIHPLPSHPLPRQQAHPPTPGHAHLPYNHHGPSLPMVNFSRAIWSPDNTFSNTSSMSSLATINAKPSFTNTNISVPISSSPCTSISTCVTSSASTFTSPSAAAISTASSAIATNTSHSPSTSTCPAVSSSSISNLNYRVFSSPSMAYSSLKRDGSTSSRGTFASTQSKLSYVALLRKQRATVWCDCAQVQDSQLLVQHRTTQDHRSTRQITGSHSHPRLSASIPLDKSTIKSPVSPSTSSSSTVSTSISLSVTNAVRSKIRTHRPRPVAYVGKNIAGTGVPMRLSASEVDDDLDQSDDDATATATANNDSLANQGYHPLSLNRRSGSFASARRAISSSYAYLAPSTSQSISLARENDSVCSSPGVLVSSSSSSSSSCERPSSSRSLSKPPPPPHQPNYYQCKTLEQTNLPTCRRILNSQSSSLSMSDLRDSLPSHGYSNPVSSENSPPRSASVYSPHSTTATQSVKCSATTTQRVDSAEALVSLSSSSSSGSINQKPPAYPTSHSSSNLASTAPINSDPHCHLNRPGGFENGDDNSADDDENPNLFVGSGVRLFVANPDLSED